MKRLLLATLFLTACGDDGPEQVKNDAGMHDAGPPDAACFMNPQTHNEIINACTPAQKIFKDSHPPLQHPDGTLPSLPP